MVPDGTGRGRLGALEALKVARVDVVAPGRAVERPYAAALPGAPARMYSTAGPGAFAAALNSPLPHCAPLSRRMRIPLDCPGRSSAMASATGRTAGRTAGDALAGVENTHPGRRRANASGMRGQRHRPPAPCCTKSSGPSAAAGQK